MVSIADKFFLMFCFIFVILSCHANGQSRVALVIGNHHYKNDLYYDGVDNTKDTAEKLKRLGFDVALVIDGDKKQFRQAINQFSEKLHEDTLGIFYYSGFAFQFDGQNYLVPTDSDAKSKGKIMNKALNLSDIFNKIISNKLNLIVIDAMARNPFQLKIKKTLKGLSKLEAPKNGFVIYPTQPDTYVTHQHRNYFNQAFRKALMQTDNSVKQLFESTRKTVIAKTKQSQIPWMSELGTKVAKVVKPIGKIIDTGAKSHGEKGNLNDKNVVIDVLFGTNRRRMFNRPLAERYGGKMGQFELGVAAVSIPKSKHVIGEIEAPKWWRFETQRELDKHFVLLSINNLNDSDFYRKVNHDLKERVNTAVFVFIHGYAVSFEKAIFRTAQLTYDLQYPGIPVAYSWPANGSITSYMADKERADLSYPHLKRFLKAISKKTKATEIHILAHSMGSRVLVKAIKDLELGNVKLNNVILAAPDINSRIFKDNIAPHLMNKAQRYSIYASSNDKALQASRLLQSASNRLGEIRRNSSILKGFDIIDASNVYKGGLGHSYFGDDRTLLTDLFYLIKQNSAPADRFLVSKMKSGVKYWVFKK